MNPIQTGNSPTARLNRNVRLPINIYHLHPLVAGPLGDWRGEFERIAAMGFSHACLAPPFEPGASGDIFVHATFDRLHPALGFQGTAEEGLRLAVEQAASAGLGLMLDIAPGCVAVDSQLRHYQPDWFVTSGPGEIADPRRPPRRIDVATTRLGESALAGVISNWWIELLTQVTAVGIVGFRCLTLDLTPSAFWRNIISALPDAVFLAWTPGVSNPRDFSDAGFSLTCSSAGCWDNPASWLLDEQVRLQDIAPTIGALEPSFLDRLAHRLAPEVNVADAYRLALKIAAATSNGLFLPMGYEFATSRSFDSVLASPSDMELAMRDRLVDLSADIRAAIQLAGDLPPARRLRPLTSPASPVTALLRSEALVLINPDVARPAAIEFCTHPLPQTAGRPLTVDGNIDSTLKPGEVRIIRCLPTSGISTVPEALTRERAEATRIAIEAIEPGSEFPAKTVVGRALTVRADVFADGDVGAAQDALSRDPSISDADWPAALEVFKYHKSYKGEA